MSNFIMMTDGYKFSHPAMLPPNTQEMYSYIEARIGAKHAKQKLFGLQYHTMKYMAGRAVTMSGIDEAKQFCKTYFGSEAVFNPNIWIQLIKDTGGYLPLEIRALPEGHQYPVGTPWFTVRNTVPGYGWLVGQAETLLSHNWYPSDVATLDTDYYDTIKAAMVHSADDDSNENCEWRLHDFGYRGVSCEEQAALGAAAHLLTFTGTDTIPGFGVLKDYYGIKPWKSSIPAMEHSTILAWGKAREGEALRNALLQYPDLPVSILTDTYNVNHCLSNIIGTQLKYQILKRTQRTIIRLDSGVPKDSILNGLNRMAEAFGITVNKKGFRVLHDKIRILQGDGIKNPAAIREIYDHIHLHGWSAENIFFGSGGGLLQRVNRDDENVAFKVSNMIVEGRSFGVAKETPGKESKRGKFEGLPMVFFDGVAYRRPLHISHSMAA